MSWAGDEVCHPLATLRTKLESQRAALQEREKVADAAVKTLAERTQPLDAKIQRRVQAEIELRKRETELEQLSHALLLDEFIKDRAGSDDYRKQLGFLALVRRDFERLSDLIAKAHLEWCSPDKDSEPALLNRIVLYIDDLDRCKVATVLKVLEAVHLLLAFPLFVCVVVVDPWWIEECLHQRHDFLFGIKPDGDGESPKPPDDAHVTVSDDLEKIFQIPIWMRPIDAKQRADVVKSLLGGTAAPPPRGVSAHAKASLPDFDQQDFVRHDASSPRKVCISQLAFFTGQPRLAPWLVWELECLGSAVASSDTRSVHEWFFKLPEETRDPLERALKLVPDGNRMTLACFCEWLPLTSKYLDTRVAVELDGAQHLADPVAYRRDRRKDQVLQEDGYLVLRFLAEDVGRELDAVLDAMLRALSNRQLTAPPVAPLSFVRRSRT